MRLLTVRVDRAIQAIVFIFTKCCETANHRMFDDFPVRQMVVLSLIRFSEPIAFTSLFPYLYFMIRDFKIAPTEQDISKYSGYLASCFALCQFLFAVRWGKLSDRIGRKPVLLMGLAGTALSLIMFGFSTNYYCALFSRSLAGALNGNIAVLRTVVGEVATERRHHAMAFLMLPLIFNFGSILGPAIGGSSYLTRPSKDLPYTNSTTTISRAGALATTWLKTSSPLSSSSGIVDRILSKYPYAMSNIVVAVFLMMSLIIGALFMEETHEKLRYKQDYGVELGDWLLLFIGIKAPPRPWNNAPGECGRLLPDNELGDSETAFKSQVDYENAFTRPVITAMTANFIISLHTVAHNEFLPVFLASRFQPNKLEFPFRIAGGLGLDVGSIGRLMLVTGIVGMLIILIAFPIMDAKMGTIIGYRFSVAMFPPVYFLTPWLVFTLHKYNAEFPTWFTTFVLYVLVAVKTLGGSTGFLQIMLLNHRAAAPRHRAYVNASTMGFSSLARFAGPIAFGYVMSVSDQKEIGWFSWWLMAALATVGMVQSFFIRDYDD